MIIKGVPAGRLCSELLRYGHHDWLQDLEAGYHRHWLSYDAVVDKVTGLFARGETFLFDPRMTVVTYYLYKCESPAGWDRLSRIHYEKELRDLQTRQPVEVPHPAAGAYCIFLGVWSMRKGSPRTIHYESPDANVKRGWRKRRMEPRAFLRWARPVA